MMIERIRVEMEEIVNTIHEDPEIWGRIVATEIQAALRRAHQPEVWKERFVKGLAERLTEGDF